jgi:hypothetical protein
MAIDLITRVSSGPSNSRIVYAEDYGVVANGSTDDIEALNSVTSNLSDSATLILPQGDILISDSWFVYNKPACVFQSNGYRLGQKTRILWNGIDNGTMNIVNRSYGCRFQGIQFVAKHSASSPKAKICVDIAQTSNSAFRPAGAADAGTTNTQNTWEACQFNYGVGGDDAFRAVQLGLNAGNQNCEGMLFESCDWIISGADFSPLGTGLYLENNNTFNNRLRNCSANNGHIFAHIKAGDLQVDGMLGGSFNVFLKIHALTNGMVIKNARLEDVYRMVLRDATTTGAMITWENCQLGARRGGRLKASTGAMTSGSAVVSSAPNDFFGSADIGFPLTVPGAGVAGADLTANITGVTDSKTATLATAASTTVSNKTLTIEYMKTVSLFDYVNGPPLVKVTGCDWSQTTWPTSFRTYEGGSQGVLISEETRYYSPSTWTDLGFDSFEWGGISAWDRGLPTLTVGFKIFGGVSFGVLPVTGSETLGIKAGFVPVSNGNTNVTLSLEAAADRPGKFHYIKKVDTGTGTITIDPAGNDTIEHTATYVFGPAQDSYVAIVSDGVSNWSIVASSSVAAIAARVVHSANQSIASGSSGAALAFDTEYYDTDTIHDTATNNTRLTCKTAGKYSIIGMAVWDINATGTRQLHIRLNGSTLIGSFSLPGVSSQNVYMLVATDYDLAVNDYLELIAVQDSGVSLNVLISGAHSPTFMMARLGA